MNDTPPNLGGNPTTAKTSTLAIWSLVLGILSLACFSIFTAIPGVICGHKALGRIKRSGGVLTGHGLAIAGLITGYIGIAFAVFMIPLMVAIAVPNFVKAREAALTQACINNLRQIDSAKQEWALENKKKASDVPTASDLAPYLKAQAGQMPKCVAGGEYKINAAGEPPTCTIPKHEMP